MHEGGNDFAFDPQGNRILVSKLASQDDSSEHSQVVWVQRSGE